MQQRNFWLYILLSIVTCGIYSIYFWYVFTEDINRICEGDGQESPNYIIVLLLSIVTCSIYMFYWYYKQAERLYAAAPRYGVSVTETGSTILLWMIVGSFVCGIGQYVGQYFMINNMNKFAERYTGQPQ